MGKITFEQLKFRQAMPLDMKIKYSLRRIMDHVARYGQDSHVSFSGGKDSTVLLHLARSIYPDLPALFANTGLEYPEIVDFVRSIDNVTTIRPKKTFRQVVDEYGYPVISKTQSYYISQVRNTKSQYLRDMRLGIGPKGWGKNIISKKWRYMIDAPFKISDKCCYWLKKAPLRSAKTANMVGTMACDSKNREMAYMRNGCFNVNDRITTPLSFWTEADIWEYLRGNNIHYSAIYDMGYDRTGCIFCMYGVHLEPLPNRFQRMKETHPKLYYYCMDDLGLSEPLRWLGVPHGSYY